VRSLAQQKHSDLPEDCPNTFNLALYHLVADNLPTAQGLYQTAFQQPASLGQIQEAIRDLEDLLRVFPEHAAAQQVKVAMEKRLKNSHD
jgi:uncharacterized protein YecE (DUF72 family)